MLLVVARDFMRQMAQPYDRGTIGKSLLSGEAVDALEEARVAQKRAAAAAAAKERALLVAGAAAAVEGAAAAMEGAAAAAAAAEGAAADAMEIG
jgi:hypothetical protein